MCHPWSICSKLSVAASSYQGGECTLELAPTLLSQSLLGTLLPWRKEPAPYKTYVGCDVWRACFVADERCWSCKTVLTDQDFVVMVSNLISGFYGMPHLNPDLGMSHYLMVCLTFFFFR